MDNEIEYRLIERRGTYRIQFRKGRMKWFATFEVQTPNGYEPLEFTDRTKAEEFIKKRAEMKNWNPV